MVKVTRRTVAIGFVAAGGGRLGRADRGGGEDARRTRRPACRSTYSAPTDWMQLSPEEMAGIAYFRQENCISLPRDRRPRRQGRAGPDGKPRSTKMRRG